MRLLTELITTIFTHFNRYDIEDVLRCKYKLKLVEIESPPEQIITLHMDLPTTFPYKPEL